MPTSEQSTSPPTIGTADTLSAGHHVSSWLTFIVTAIVALAADQVSKAMTFHFAAGEPIVIDPDNPSIPIDQRPIVIVPSLLSIKLTTNTGAVFGLGKGAQTFFIVVSIIAVIVITHVFWGSPPGAYVFHVCLGLILAGALGNLYDRLVFNAVRDFFYLFPDLHLPFGLQWPGGDDRLYPWIFNVADASLVGGVTVLLVVMWRGERSQRHAAPPHRPPEAGQKDPY